jgi:hypothetical protein
MGVIYLNEIKYELAITILSTSVLTITINRSYPQNLFLPALRVLFSSGLPAGGTGIFNISCEIPVIYTTNIYLFSRIP